VSDRRTTADEDPGDRQGHRHPFQSLSHLCHLLVSSNPLKLAPLRNEWVHAEENL
jgi:hypothetical protein